MILADLARERIEKRAAPAKPIDLLEWMLTRRRYLAAGKLFDLASHPYLEEIYKLNPTEAVYCKAGQVGISEYLLSWLIWSADQRQATGLYVMPTDGIVSDFSAARLGSAIEPEVSPYLAGLVGSASRQAHGSVGKGRRGADRVGLKRFRDRFIYLRGGQVRPDGRAPQLRSIDADVLVIDEYDEMDTRVPSLARERLGHSALAEIRKASTPTYANTGIHAEYQTTDQRSWQVKCDHCGDWQALGLSSLIIESDDLERPVAWHEDDQGPYLVCLKCGGKLDRLAKGEWVAAYPGRPVWGYHLSRLFSHVRPLSEIITGLQKVDDDDRQQTYNQGLGLSYSSPTAIKLTPDLLKLCQREYGPGIVPIELKPQKIAMGVDVGTVLHVIIRTKMPNGDSRLVTAEQVNDFADLLSLVKQYGVGQVVIDALPETRQARDFINTLPKGVGGWLAYYDTQVRGKKTVDWASFNEDESTVTIDRTRSLDHLMAAFTLAARGEPGHTLTANAQNTPDYFKHLTSTERRLRRAADGNQVAVYVETGADHYLHAENYCLVAMQAGPKWRTIKFLNPAAKPG